MWSYRIYSHNQPIFQPHASCQSSEGWLIDLIQQCRCGIVVTRRPRIRSRGNGDPSISLSIRFVAYLPCPVVAVRLTSRVYHEKSHERAVLLCCQPHGHGMIPEEIKPRHLAFDEAFCPFYGTCVRRCFIGRPETGSHPSSVHQTRGDRRPAFVALVVGCFETPPLQRLKTGKYSKSALCLCNMTGARQQTW